MLDACRQARIAAAAKICAEASAGVTLARLSLFWPPCRCLAPLGHQGYLPQSPGRCGDLWAIYQEISKAKMLIIALLSAACGAHAAEERLTIASTFRPWALNDSQAFVFPRIAEKRNRGRRERLADQCKALAVSRDCASARRPRADQTGVQEVLSDGSDGSGGARDREAH